MVTKEKNPTIRSQHSLLLFIITILILQTLVGCGPSSDDLMSVDHTPLPGDDWKVSTPEEQGLDPMLTAATLTDIQLFTISGDFWGLNKNIPTSL